jgi:hypothetical protein
MNKPTFLLIMLIVFSLNSFGQLFPDSTALWSYYNSDIFGTIDISQYYQNDDTLINNTGYKKLFYSRETTNLYNDSLFYANYNEYTGALRSDNNQKKVFFIPKDQHTEVLLYDFTLEVGDTIPIWHDKFFHVITIESIDTIVVNGKALRRFEMNNKSVYEHAIIEGIGSIRDFVYVEDYMEGIHGFQCFKDFQKNFIYPEECDFMFLSSVPDNNANNKIRLSIKPNPCSNNFMLSFNGINSVNYRAEMIDINGIKVKDFLISKMNQIIDTGLLKNGIYLLIIYDKSELISQEKLLIMK